MKVDYHRFYDDFKGWNTDGNPVQIRRNDNHLFIESSGVPIQKLTYTVKQSFGDKEYWNNIIGCGGTIFSEDAFLLNFQLITGYFEGYKDSPFEISFQKSRAMYGATAMKVIERSDQKDIYSSEDYSSLIDQPILYAKADTSGFKIGNNRFHVAIHSENGFLSAAQMSPNIQRIMESVTAFSGLTSTEDYHFIFYFIGLDKLTSTYSRFGLGSALEHENSSVYYFSDNPFYDPEFSNFSGIIAHEYLHTITPLGLHSEKIRDFNFDTPDNSRHLWLYEGVTDYLATLANSRNDSIVTIYLSTAAQFSEERTLQSMTESSLRITETNKKNFDEKITELNNFYQKGKLIAFVIDMELMERSNGQTRLLDVLLKMKQEFESTPFDDTQLFQELTKRTYPEMAEFCDKYIVGKELVPFEEYFQKLGWQYQRTGTMVKSFGSGLNIPFNFDMDTYFVSEAGSNSFDLKKGDRITKINGRRADLTYSHSHGLFLELDDTFESGEVTIEVIRDDQTLILIGSKEFEFPLRTPRIKVSENFSADQLVTRQMFFGSAD